MSIRYNINNFTFESIDIDSKNELKYLISSHGNGFIINDDEILSSDKSILLKVKAIHSNSKCSLGIITGESVTPQIVAHPNCGNIWLGIDNYVYILSVIEREIISKEELPSYFLDLVTISKNQLIVIHELGAKCYDDNMNTLWNLESSDMIDNYTIDNKKIVLSSMDGKSISREL